MKNFFKQCKNTILSNKDLLLFPIAGSIVWFILPITSTNFNIEWINDINVWISSFLITFTTYCIFDILLGRLSLFKKYKFLLAIISFFVSTCIGGSMNLIIRENISWIQWLMAIIGLILGFTSLSILGAIGYNDAIDKRERALQIEIKKIKDTINNLSVEEKKDLALSCNKALSLDDRTFGMILCMQNKEMIKELLEDIHKSNV